MFVDKSNTKANSNKKAFFVRASVGMSVLATAIASMAAVPSKVPSKKVIMLPGGIFHQMPSVGAPEQKQPPRARLLFRLGYPLGSRS